MINEKQSFFLKNISIFCLLFFPASLVSGPFLAEILMNLISIIFIYNLYKKRDFSFCRDKFFIIFSLFYVYIFVSSFFSEYAENIIYKNFFYFRYIFFVYAISELLLNNNIPLLFYRVLLFTIFLVSADAFVQYLTGTNITGNVQLRDDRVAGLFGDQLILGSYLSRLFPLLIGLFFYNQKNLKSLDIIISIIIFIFILMIIIISGERMAFIVTILYLILAIFLNHLKKKIKILFFSFFAFFICMFFIFNPNLVERHYKQTVDQVNLNFSQKNFFANFVFYDAIYNTALNGFLDKIIYGQGPRSFRFFCSNPKLESYVFYKNNISLKEISGLKEIIIEKIFFDNNQFIKKGDAIFLYLENNKKKIFSIENDVIIKNSNFYGIIGKTVKTDIYFIEYEIKKNGCTTHPHNFYLQILSEAGIIGFLFIFILFLFFLYLIVKYSYIYLFKGRYILSGLQINLALGFLLTLLPIIPNGNFFNNWLNMIIFFPVGFYIFSLKIDKIQ